MRKKFKSMFLFIVVIFSFVAAPAKAADDSTRCSRYHVQPSPDGNTLLIVTEHIDEEISLIDAKNGTLIKMLAKVPSLLWTMPSWSPDGTKIAYTALEKYTLVTYVIEGERQTKVAVGGINIGWSKDGKVLMAKVDYAYSVNKVTLAETYKTAPYVFSMALSINGDEAFISENVLFIKKESEKDGKKIAKTEHWKTNLVWSPDAKFLAVHYNDLNKLSIYSVEGTLVNKFDNVLTKPVWTSNTTMAATHVPEYGTPLATFNIKEDGTHKLSNVTRYSTEVGFSQITGEIFYISEFTDENPSYDIHAIKPDGTGFRKVTTSAMRCR